VTQVRYAKGLDSLMVEAEVLSPHPRNPNNGDTEEIVASILSVGCYRPIYANLDTGRIVGGHHVYEALLSLGETRVPVVWGTYSAEDEMRVLVADNGIARRARMDPALELELLTELHGTDRGLVGVGSDEYDLARLKAELEDPFHPGVYTAPEEGTEDYGHTCTQCGGICHGT